MNALVSSACRTAFGQWEPARCCHRAHRIPGRGGRHEEASKQAAEALAISTTLYRDGLDNYLSVSVAQVQALAAELVEVQLRVRQVQASVSLICALGGEWSVQRLVPESEVAKF